MVVLKPAALRVAAHPAPARVMAALALAILALGAVACAHGGGGGGGEPLPGPSGRLDPIYDTTILFPDAVVVVQGLSYQGLSLDLEITFDDATVRDTDPRFRAPVRVVGVTAGGVVQSFAVPQPIVMEGSIDGPALETDLFGAIQFGSANLVLSLSGTIEDGARQITGQASLFGTSSTGLFTAERRRRYLVAGTDFQSPFGQASVVDVRYSRDIGVTDAVETISSDPVARVRDGRPVIVNRLSFDNLQGLDPHASFRTTFQYSTGNGSNPHDLAIVDDATAGVTPGAATGGAGVAFVTRYEPPYDDVALFNLDDGSLLGSIDLTPYARNADHLPRADQILLQDGLLWVTMQDANRSFTTFMTGRLAIIDPAGRTVIDVLDLAGQNPFESLVYAPETGLIYVALAGIFPGLETQALTGGIEAIDPVTRTSRGLIVDDDLLGGNVSAVAIVAADRGYAVVTDQAFKNYVKAFDPGTGAVLGTVYETTDRIAGLVSDGDGWLLVAESSFVAPRLLILDGKTAALVASLPLRQPPVSIAVMTRSL